MSLLNEICNDLTNESAGLPNTLRKALMLAYELQSQELKDWATCELYGYRTADLTPDYRRLNLPVFGTFHGPFQGKMTKVPISTNGLHESVKGYADTLVFTESVAALESMLSSHHEAFYRTFNPELTKLLRNSVPMTGDMVLFEAYHQIPRYLFARIADSVKTRLLIFVLGWQEKNMTPGNTGNGNAKHYMVRNIFNTTISGGNNIIVTGEVVRQSHNLVQNGNIDSLLEHLRSNGVGEDDLRDLNNAVVSEPNVPGNGFGPKVTAWLGKMTTKAISGAWQASVSDAPAMLVKALQQFYGG